MDNIKVLGVPFDFGQTHSGVRLASSFLKMQGLIPMLSKHAFCKNLGEIVIAEKDLHQDDAFIKNKSQCSEYNEVLSHYIENIDLNSSFLLNVGGDHGLGLGSIHGILSHDPNTVVVWADAHGDINTQYTSPSGNFHGMPLAFLLGVARDPSFAWITESLLPENLIFFGPRDLDEGEKDIIKRLGIQYFSSDEINRIGSQEVIEMALHRADPMGVKSIHLSLDVDLFDSNDVAATGTRVLNGPRQEEVFLMGGLLAQTGRLRSMDIVEFNPLIGSKKEVLETCELILKFLDNTLEQVFDIRTKDKHTFDIGKKWRTKLTSIFATHL